MPPIIIGHQAMGVSLQSRKENRCFDVLRDPTLISVLSLLIQLSFHASDQICHREA